MSEIRIPEEMLQQYKWAETDSYPGGRWPSAFVKMLIERLAKAEAPSDDTPCELIYCHVPQGYAIFRRDDIRGLVNRLRAAESTQSDGIQVPGGSTVKQTTTITTPLEEK